MSDNATPERADWNALAAFLTDDQQVIDDFASAATDAEEWQWAESNEVLYEADLIGSFDWKEHHSDITWGLEKVPAAKAAGLTFGEDDLDDEVAKLCEQNKNLDPTRAAMQILAPQIEAKGLGAVYLDEDSDAYPIALLPKDRVAAFVAAAAACGIETEVWI